MANLREDEILDPNQPVEGQEPILQGGGRDPGHQEGGQDLGPKWGGQAHLRPMGRQDPSHQVGGQNPNLQAGGQGHHLHEGERDQSQPVGGQDPILQGVGRDPHQHVEDQDHYQPETLPKYAAEGNASKDDVPQDHINADKIGVPNDVDGDHTHPDEGGVPKTPEEGDIQKSLDKKISKKISQTIDLTFQTEISAGMTKNQLVEPAGQEPKTTANSALTAKTDKSEVKKKEAEPPEVSNLPK